MTALRSSRLLVPALAPPAARPAAAAPQPAEIDADALVERALAILAQEDRAWQARRPAGSAGPDPRVAP